MAGITEMLMNEEEWKKLTVNIPNKLEWKQQSAVREKERNTEKKVVCNRGNIYKCKKNIRDGEK